MTDQSSGQSQWSDTLERFGLVEFRRSRRTAALFLLMSLGFVAIAITMMTTGSTADRVNGTLAGSIFGVAAIAFVAILVRNRPVLIVRRDGLHVPLRKPLDVPWEQVIGVVDYNLNRMSPRSLAIFVWPVVLEQYRETLPWAIRLLGRVLPKTAQWRSFVPIQMLAVPCEDLAEWIDIQVDARAAVPAQLCLVPGDDTSPVWGLPSRRPIALRKLRISADLENQLISWAKRAAVPFERELNGEAPGPALVDLRAEGRSLSTRLEHQLGVGHTVTWLEDLQDAE